MCKPLNYLYPLFYYIRNICLNNLGLTEDSITAWQLYQEPSPIEDEKCMKNRIPIRDKCSQAKQTLDIYGTVD